METVLTELVAPHRETAQAPLCQFGRGLRCKPHKGSGHLGPRGRGRSNPTPPRGDQEEGGHLTLGPDVPEGKRSGMTPLIKPGDRWDRSP
uniref:Uncharacterized protein n=1 Tax=Oryza sativa subsp. japonica TaxID=39947 RepID=Q6YYW8_ORYSJ|nr:hypothetical protein [Oryza sativa Japonica Group]